MTTPSRGGETARAGHGRARSTRRSLVVGLGVAAWLVLTSACKMDPHGWYRYDDHPGVTIRPFLEFEENIEAPTKGAPARMMAYCLELEVNCAYCHVDANAVTCDLTMAGTTSVTMIDLSERFKVDCAYCHDKSPTKLTKAGRYANRDMRIPERRWTCAGCHDLGFKVIRKG